MSQAYRGQLGRFWCRLLRASTKARQAAYELACNLIAAYARRRAWARIAKLSRSARVESARVGRCISLTHELGCRYSEAQRVERQQSRAMANWFPGARGES